MIDPVLEWLIALAFAVLFASAASLKLRESAAFVATLADYRLVPRKMSGLAGVLIIAVECAVAAGLLWPATRATSGLIGAGLMLIYGSAIAVNLIRGRHEIDCGCSLQRRPIGRWMVIRNLIFAAALSILALPVAERPLGVGDLATITAGVFVLALLYVSLDLLLGRTDVGRNVTLEHP
jgi:methylamine utilization protein MauE